MAISDIYVGRVATASADFSTSSPVAILSVFGTATKRVWVVGVRCEITNTAAAAGNSVVFTLARSTSTNITASSAKAALGVAQDQAAPAALCSFATGWSTTPAGTLSILAEWTIPNTVGSAWEEFPPLGYEWGVPAIASGSNSAGLHLFATSTTTSGTTIAADIIWSE